MERKAYNATIVGKVTKLTINLAHPDWTDEQISQEAQKKEHVDKTIFDLTVMDFRNKLIEEYGDRRTFDYCKEKAEYIMQNIPSELIVNVNEYIDNKPLTDIKVHGVSINDILQTFVPRKIHIVQALECMAKWKEYEYFDEMFWRNYFAIA